MKRNDFVNARKRALSLFLAAMIIFSCVSVSFVYASNLSSSDQAKVNEYKAQQEAYKKKIEEKKAEIDSLKSSKAPVEAYAKELSAQIDNYQGQIDVLVNDIAALESQKAAIQLQIDDLNKEIGKIEDNITKNEIEQAQVQSQIDDIYAKFKERLCEIYVNGSTSDLELLLDCDEVSDFSTYLIMIEISQRRAKNDEKMVEDLNASIEKIAELTNKYNAMIAEIEVKKQEHQTKVDELTANELVIETDKKSLETSQAELETLKAEAFSKIAELDKASDAASALIAQYEEECASIEAEIDALISLRAAKSSSVVKDPGGFIWPLQYSDAYVSSHYGYRSDPISGEYKLHGGTDTCCESGTYGKEVVASADGTVIIADYAPGSYGYYVAIDHGNGIVTLYAHNSALNVSEGDNVRQGEVVAYAGQTGYATGAHCHFEVRVDGSRVDAEDYAPAP